MIGAVRRLYGPCKPEKTVANKLSTRRALITGASSGIGAGLAERLAAQGIEVWCVARRAEALAEVVGRIEKAGGKAHALTLDVGQADATAARLAQLDEETGGIDLVVANAGLGGERGARTVLESTWEDTRDLFQVNLLGAVATLSPFIRPMAKRGFGQLVGISSIAADLPIPRGPAYGASKAGLTFWLECLDIELRPLGVAVTAVHPGFVRTPMTAEVEDPMPFIVELEQAVRTIDAGIRSRERMVRFPWVLGAVSRSTRALPRALAAPLINLATRPRKQG
jgi:short-subunit dehydrogenase